MYGEGVVTQLAWWGRQRTAACRRFVWSGSPSIPTTKAKDHIVLSASLASIILFHSVSYFSSFVPFTK